MEQAPIFRARHATDPGCEHPSTTSRFQGCRCRFAMPAYGEAPTTVEISEDGHGYMSPTHGLHTICAAHISGFTDCGVWRKLRRTCGPTAQFEDRQWDYFHFGGGTMMLPRSGGPDFSLVAGWAVPPPSHGNCSEAVPRHGGALNEVVCDVWTWKGDQPQEDKTHQPQGSATLSHLQRLYPTLWVSHASARGSTRTKQAAITQKIRPFSALSGATACNAPLRAGKPQEPKALHTRLGVAWVAPDWDPSPRLVEWASASPTIP
ncbi:hypothetical protein CC86DRAFT_420081 [Ophiobolus disseminans]|uniref:Uncharacterized protein n=1 Tax=Ophiobolus disseminans TaxID=1469910 RepID=A0A6A6ZUV3_9PLEO|nr:hypothetical protein CC86DRAFT_420081 [Ophiobolus disseminans]